MRLRVGLDARFSSARYDGVGRYVSALAHELPRLPGAAVLHLLRPDAGDAPRHPLPADGFGIETLATRRTRPPESLWSWLAVPRLAHAAHIDVWHTPFPMAPPVTRSASVITLHDCIPERNPGYFGGRARVAYRAAVAVGLRTADRVIVPSELTAEDAQRFHRVPAAKMRLVPLGVEPPQRAPAPAEAAAIRDRLGLPEGYVLTVGRPRPHKAFAMLVRALAALPPERRPLLVRVGRADPRVPDGSDDLAAALGVPLRVLVGITDAELASLYAGAGVVAIPSAIEGFGLPLLEALAAGAPVLASDIQPFRATGGDAARYVEGTAGAWQEAVSAALDDSAWRAAALRCGPERAALFPWSAMAQATLDVYTEVA